MNGSPDSGRLSYSSDTSSIFRLPIGSDDQFSSTLSVNSEYGKIKEEIVKCVVATPVSHAIPCKFVRSSSLPDMKSNIEALHRSVSFTYNVSTPTSNKVFTIPTPPPPPPIRTMTRAFTNRVVPTPPPLPPVRNLMTGASIIPILPSPLPTRHAANYVAHNLLGGIDYAFCIICGDEDALELEKLPCCGCYICYMCQHVHVMDSTQNRSTVSCPNQACKPDVICEPSECIVCYDEVTRKSQQFKRSCCSEVVCRSCMAEVVKTNIHSEGRVQIMCPSPDCDGVVTREEIIDLVDRPTMDKYERLCANQEVSKFRKTCPNCNEITERRLPKKLWNYHSKDIHVTCQKCKHDWCFNCHAPWHKGVTCRQFQKGDKQFKKWTKSNKNGVPNCQKCPVCRVNIQKSAGCNHMTCNRCRTEFCYRCGSFYNFRVPIFGGHHNRTSIFGCKYNYSEKGSSERKAIRGGYFGAKLAMLTGYPVLFVAGVAIVIVGAAIALPIYGAYKYSKYRKTKRIAQARARRHTQLL